MGHRRRLKLDLVMWGLLSPEEVLTHGRGFSRYAMLLELELEVLNTAMSPGL